MKIGVKMYIYSDKNSKKEGKNKKNNKIKENQK
jgi:hypothetical protein